MTQLHIYDQALLIVMRRGSLRAAEEITGHKYETISVWLKRAQQALHWFVLCFQFGFDRLGAEGEGRPPRDDHQVRH